MVQIKNGLPYDIEGNIISKVEWMKQKRIVDTYFKGEKASGLSSVKYSPEDIELTNYLHSQVMKNFSFLANKRPTARDYEEMNRLNRIDGYSYDLIRQVIDWSQNNYFWHRNIRSTLKLRRKFEDLLVQAKADNDRKAQRVAVI